MFTYLLQTEIGISKWIRIWQLLSSGIFPPENQQGILNLIESMLTYVSLEI